MGFRVDLDHTIFNELNPDSGKFFQNCHKLMVDDQMLIFGTDSTIEHHFNKTPKQSIVIGDGVLLKKTPNHISSPWSPSIWLTEFPTEIVHLTSRQGWCCTMRCQRFHRDAICKHLTRDLSIFDHKNYFCYDCVGSEFSDIEKYMFRLPFRGQETELTLKRKKLDSKMMVAVEGHKKTQTWLDGCLGPWHHECVIELVPETSCEVFFVTEKTIKPIAAGMPFVMVSCHKFLHRLRKMGFKTFHPFIDESYDLITSHDRRIEMAVESFSAFVKNPENLSQIQSICDHNRMVLAKIRNHSWSHQQWKKLRRFITFG